MPFPDRETRVLLWPDDGIRRHRKSRRYSDLRAKGGLERSGELGTPEWPPVAPALAIVAAIGSDITRGAILADTGPDGRHDSREFMLALVEAFGARVAEAGTARPIPLSVEATSDLPTRLQEHLLAALRLLRFANFPRFSP